MRSYSDSVRWLVPVAAILLGLGLTAQVQAGTGTGEAFGVSIETADVTVAKTPHVVLPPDGSKDPVEDQLFGFDEPGLLSSSTMYVSTQGRISGNNGTITSSATTEDLDVLGGLITADMVLADSTSGEHTDQGQQKSARLSSGGSFFLGLSVAGVAVENEPPPNTTLPLPGVGIVVLNEQFETGDNLTNSSLTVNAIHVYLMDGLLPVGDIIVSSALSGVDYRR